MSTPNHTRTGLGLTCCALIIVIAQAASAQVGPSLHLDWSAPDDCSVASKVEARIRTRTAAAEASGPIEVTALLTRRGAHGYRVHLRLGGALSGERRLDAESCDAAVEAVALLVAIAIDPRHATINAATEGAEVPADASAPADATAEAPDTATPGREATTTPAAADDLASEGDNNDQHAATLQLAVGAGVAIDWGSTPGITPGALLSASLSIDRLLVSLSATALLPREASVARNSTLSAGWMSAAVDGCYLLGASFQWGPCVGAEAGRLTRSSRGLLAPDNSTETVIFASGSLIARTQLTPAIYAALWLGMRTPISYPRLLVTGVGEAFRPAPLGVRATLMLTVVLG